MGLDRTQALPCGNGTGEELMQCVAYRRRRPQELEPFSTGANPVAEAVCDLLVPGDATPRYPSSFGVNPCVRLPNGRPLTIREWMTQTDDHLTGTGHENDRIRRTTRPPERPAATRSPRPGASC